MRRRAFIAGLSGEAASVFDFEIATTRGAPGNSGPRDVAPRRTTTPNCRRFAPTLAAAWRC
jgi:hypothetical protein